MKAFKSLNAVTPPTRTSQNAPVIPDNPNSKGKPASPQGSDSLKSQLKLLLQSLGGLFFLFVWCMCSF